MLRQERENMIKFLSRVKEMSNDKLMVLTDEDLEHLYSRTYTTHEAYEEVM
ncbi:BH0509 family protein [Salipaludibacillus sp. CUR1]|uniref:BH0509 family protein n=1 Tax=Salipaludibacillus sp. CUR1 TaxID=2820003 RepID=UPI001E2E3AEE|nr:BH0509 family protein [Salipaludibacillus sp. CUR1]MCE7794830.1 BH0509 family protein [Salipaludibacillus sp. CUR1]